MSFKSVADTINKAPLGSTVDEFIEWIGKKGLNTSILNNIEKKEKGQGFTYETNWEAATLAVCFARMLAALVVLPTITPLGALYNSFTGSFKLCSGMVTYLSDRKEAKKKVEEGLIHLMTAVYDLALGLFLNTGFLGVALAVGYGISDQVLRTPHLKIYGDHPMFKRDNKKEGDKDTPPPLQKPKSWIELASISMANSLIPEVEVSWIQRLKNLFVSTSLSA